MRGKGNDCICAISYPAVSGVINYLLYRRIMPPALGLAVSRLVDILLITFLIKSLQHRDGGVMHQLSLDYQALRIGGVFESDFVSLVVHMALEFPYSFLFLFFPP